MANWQRTLDLLDIWDKYPDEMSIQDISSEISKRLLAMKPLDNDDIDEMRLHIADDFQCLSEDESAEEDDFNGIMNNLYDWADTNLDGHWNGKKVAWIKTNF
jgi:hypothetical protein